MRALEQKRILIIGAGPTGLGAAHRLHELGHRGFTLVEQSAHIGGLAASFLDENGFTWDVGGHVQFSHYTYFDNVMDDVLKDQWIHHERESWIWIRDRFVPYPFQNNIHYLPDEDKKKCLRGLIRVAQHNHAAAPLANFADWINRSFGEGIAEIFLLPYNFKVWAYPPSELSHHWVGERVATVDLERVIENLVDGKNDVGWGPNNTFRFPLHGGTGEIWRRVASRLPSGSVQLNKRVERVETAARRVSFSDGSAEPYDILISTMPLDRLVQLSDLDTVRDNQRPLKFSTVHVVGVGLKGSPPPHLQTKCWIYFPESNSPFYRATVFSRYSPNNVPDASKYWSLMLEVSESPAKPVDHESVVESVVDGLLASRLIASKSDICDIWRYIAPHGYPTPFLQRDSVTQPLIAALEKVNVFSRGRFGAWKYEVSNQDHSFMQGVELVDRLGFGVPEMTINYPNIVNAHKR